MAVAMRARFAELSEAWRHHGYELGFGVGIAVGYATLGRIGFEGRHDYGAIGNVTILASRLSSQAKGGQILLSPRELTAQVMLALRPSRRTAASQGPSPDGAQLSTGQHYWHMSA